MDPRCTRLDQNRRLRRAISPGDYRDATPERHQVFDPQLIVEDDGDANYPDGDRHDLLRRDPFIGQKDPREHQPKYRDHRLKHRGEPGRDVLFGPEDAAVVDRELKHPGQRDQPPFCRRARQWYSL